MLFGKQMKNYFELYFHFFPHDCQEYIMALKFGVKLTCFCILCSNFSFVYLYIFSVHFYFGEISFMILEVCIYVEKSD